MTSTPSAHGRRLRAASAALAALLAIASARADAQVRLDVAELHMGVSVRMVLFAPDDSAARLAANAAFARVGELEDVMSDYRSRSELRRLEGRAGQWTPVSEELFAVLARALEVARASDGAFDPTVGPIVALWREARRTLQLPSQKALASALASSGWERVTLDSARRRVRLSTDGMRLDLGGIAKGWILQDALRVLRAHGAGRSLIEAGGDIVVGDPPPNSQGWRIETPTADARVSALAARLANAAVSTSGATEQFVEIGGVRYSHIVDPRTGLGLTSGWTATVIAEDGGTADALATAASVLGAGRGRELLARFGGVVGSIGTSVVGGRSSDR